MFMARRTMSWMELHPPMELPYMSRLRAILHYVGAWPNEELGDVRRTYPTRSQMGMCLMASTLALGQFLYICANVHTLDFFELGHNYITLLMTIITLQRHTLNGTKSFRKMVRLFVTEIHLLHFKDNSEINMKIYKRVHRGCSVFSIIVMMQTIFGPLLFNFTPAYVNYSRGMFGSNRPPNVTFELSTYYLTPFDYTHELLGYSIVSLANCYFTFDVTICFMQFDLLLSYIVFHMWGHMKILDYNLRHFPRPAPRNEEGRWILKPMMYSKEETKEITKMLHDNIDYHRKLMSYVREISHAFGLTLCVYYTFHQICGCILLLECSTLESKSIGEYGPVTVLTFEQMIQISVIFELIASKGDSLSDAVYNVPWEHMNVSLRKTVAIFLCNVQHSPTAIKALGMVTVGVRTMIAVSLAVIWSTITYTLPSTIMIVIIAMLKILKTSITYFLMLHTMANE